MWLGTAAPSFARSTPAVFCAAVFFAGRHADEAAGLEAEGRGDLRRLVREELCDAAGEIALLVDLEPVGLAAGLHLDIGAELVDGLAAQACTRARRRP